MRLKRRKIRMDRGDTLGGTVPLLLQGSITANGSASGLLHRDRNRGPGIAFYLFLLLVLLILAMTGWFMLPELVERLGLPTTSDVWNQIKTFFSVPPV